MVTRPRLPLQMDIAPDLPLLDRGEEQFERKEVDPADQGLDRKARTHNATLAPLREWQWRSVLERPLLAENRH